MPQSWVKRTPMQDSVIHNSCWKIVGNAPELYCHQAFNITEVVCRINYIDLVVSLYFESCVIYVSLLHRPVLHKIKEITFVILLAAKWQNTTYYLRHRLVKVYVFTPVVCLFVTRIPYRPKFSNIHITVNWRQRVAQWSAYKRFEITHL